jgi:hypothetical protein
VVPVVYLLVFDKEDREPAPVVAPVEEQTP